MSGIHHILGSQREGGSFAPTAHHRGRWASWMAVCILLAGMVATAAGLVLGPPWTVVLLGLLVLLAGAITAVVVDVWGDVVLDRPRREAEEPHTTRRRRADVDEVRASDDGAPLPAAPLKARMGAAGGRR